MLRESENPTDFRVWRQNVIDASHRAADRTYQERVWFGLGPEVDSPDELMCAFLDDLVFEQFLTHPELPQPERAAATRLFEAVQRYASRSPQQLIPSEVINDPEFETVRVAAKAFLRIL